jgi:hypothetical protein
VFANRAGKDSLERKRWDEKALSVSVLQFYAGRLNFSEL